MGVIFDGLESMFTSNMTSCANALLRAINNRKYIFAITLKLSKERLKALDDRKKAEKGLLLAFLLVPVQLDKAQAFLED